MKGAQTTLPRYRILADDLSRRLRAGEWPPQTPFPSCRQIAKSYNVGFQVARLALKALAAEGRLKVAPNRKSTVDVGTPLLSLLRNVVVVVLNSHMHYSFHRIDRESLWNNIKASAESYGYPLFVLHNPDRTRIELPIGLSAVPLRGILLIGPFSPSLLRRYENLNVPTVLIDQPGDDYRLHSVAVANHAAAFEATSRLIAAGHRRIGLFRTLLGSLQAVDPDSKEREAGFVAACVKAGFKSSQYKIFSTFIGRTRGFSGTDLLTDTPRFTAVLCCNIDHAHKVATSAKAAGLRIPRDLSILAFRSTGESETDWSGPQIDFGKLGSASIETLRRHPAVIERVRVPMAWHEGQTFAPPRKSSTSE